MRGTWYQHGGSNVELLLVLRDKDVCLNEVLLILVLDLAQYVRHPLELTLCARHPHEVHLACSTHNTSPSYKRRRQKFTSRASESEGVSRVPFFHFISTRSPSLSLSFSRLKVDPQIRRINLGDAFRYPAGRTTFTATRQVPGLQIGYMCLLPARFLHSENL